MSNPSPAATENPTATPAPSSAPPPSVSKNFDYDQVKQRISPQLSSGRGSNDWAKDAGLGVMGRHQMMQQQMRTEKQFMEFDRQKAETMSATVRAQAELHNAAIKESSDLRMQAGLEMVSEMGGTAEAWGVALVEFPELLEKAQSMKANKLFPDDFTNAALVTANDHARLSSENKALTEEARTALLAAKHRAELSLANNQAEAEDAKAPYVGEAAEAGIQAQTSRDRLSIDQDLHDKGVLNERDAEVEGQALAAESRNKLDDQNAIIRSREDLDRIRQQNAVAEAALAQVKAERAKIEQRTTRDVELMKKVEQGRKAQIEADSLAGTNALDKERVLENAKRSNAYTMVGLIQEAGLDFTFELEQEDGSKSKVQLVEDDLVELLSRYSGFDAEKYPAFEFGMKNIGDSPWQQKRLTEAVRQIQSGDDDEIKKGTAKFESLMDKWAIDRETKTNRDAYYIQKQELELRKGTFSAMEEEAKIVDEQFQQMSSWADDSDGHRLVWSGGTKKQTIPESGKTLIRNIWKSYSTDNKLFSTTMEDGKEVFIGVDSNGREYTLPPDDAVESIVRSISSKRIQLQENLREYSKETSARTRSLSGGATPPPASKNDTSQSSNAANPDNVVILGPADRAAALARSLNTSPKPPLKTGTTE